MKKNIIIFIIITNTTIIIVIIINIIMIIILLLLSLYKKKYDFSPKLRNYKSNEVYFLDFSEASFLSPTDNKADTAILSTIAYLTLVCR